MSIAKVAVIVGVGPGLGSSVAKKFAKEGYSVALVSRTPEKLEAVKKDIESKGGKALAVTADSSDPKSVSEAFAKIRTELGHPEVLVNNAGSFAMKSVLDITPEQFELHWKTNCFGHFLATKEVLGDMVNKKKGTIIFTGATASLRGGNHFSLLAVGKFGARAFAQSLAREFGPKGIHVSHVIIDGGIDTSQQGTPDKLNPDAIAETYWNLHLQDATAWTHELELRPSIEKW